MTDNQPGGQPAGEHDNDGGLFDLPDTVAAHPATEPPPSPARRAGAPVINDMDLIQEVLARATEPGYVLVSDRWVWRRRVRRGTDVEPVTAEEANAVLQLLDQRFLILGGTREVRRGGRTGPAVSVLLTDAARTRLRRWRAYLRPGSWPDRRTTA